MPAEIALQDASVQGPVEHGAPRLQLPHTLGSLLGGRPRHSPIVQVLAATHGVSEMNAPGIAVIHVGQGGSNAAFRHNSVSLAEKGFRDDGNFDASCSGFGSGAQTCATRSDHKDVVLVGYVFGH